MISDTSFFSSLRGARFLAYASEQAPQSLSEIPQSNYSRLQVRNEIATPSARNDTEGYYPMLQTYKVSPIYRSLRSSSRCRLYLWENVFKRFMGARAPERKN